MMTTTRIGNAQPTSGRTTLHRSPRAVAIVAPLLAAGLLSGCSSEDTPNASQPSTPTSTTASESSTTATTAPETSSSSRKPQPTNAEKPPVQDRRTASARPQSAGESKGEASPVAGKPTPNAAPADTQPGDYCGQVKTRDFSQPSEPVVNQKVYAVTAGTDCAAGLEAMQGYANGMPYDAYNHGNAQIVKIPGGNCSAPTAARAQETNTSMSCAGDFGEVKVPQHG